LWYAKRQEQAKFSRAFRSKAREIDTGHINYVELPDGMTPMPRSPMKRAILKAVLFDEGLESGRTLDNFPSIPMAESIKGGKGSAIDN
jgi:hypothetical protein